MTLQHEGSGQMAEVYISLAEAAELENIKYNTLVQKIKRNPEKFQLRKEQRADGGKDLSMIALSSLSKKAVAAYKERQKLAEVPVVPGMEEMEAQGGRSLPNTSHRSGLEKENVPYTGTPRAIWKHLHGRTSSIKKTVGIMNFSKSCACAGNRRKQAHFQALRQK